MGKPVVTQQALHEHVLRLGELHPPIPLDSVDRTVLRPDLVRDQYGPVIDYLARVELEVERNVLELLTLLPDAGDTDRMFYAEVWSPQEAHHGLVLDRLQQDIGRPPATPDTGTVSAKIKVLGALSHLRPVHDVTRMLYYLTGAATEKSAVLAYSRLSAGMRRLGETAIARTIIDPIKRQEPGHFAYYALAARQMVQARVLAPWQLHLTRVLRRRSFGLVGANDQQQKGDFGGIVSTLGIEAELSSYAHQISVVERELLWAGREGMHVPPYVLAALREAVELHRERGLVPGRRPEGALIT
ncbi:hypothetical protein GCM10027446_28070 [Angustibacter peucedani]